MEKLEQLKKKGVNPYPSSCGREEKIAQAQDMLGDEVSVAGRIMAWRGHGKIKFTDLKDESGSMQIVFKAGEISAEEFEDLELLDVGDFLEVDGEVFETRTGEVSVLVKKYRLLSKSLRPLPDKWHGLKDVEARYRKRYLDFLFNPDAKEKILTRTKVIKAMREYLDQNGFIEVETPILETTASGALAKPFKTHIDAYDLDIFLRICMGELWQKMLMVAGFGRTYELGRAFRNEGVSKEHNPEFTMMEYYMGYADFEDNMAFQEQLVAYVVKQATGDYEIEYQGRKINFEPPFPRKKFYEIIEEKTGVKVGEISHKELIKTAEEKGMEVEDEWGHTKLIDEFYKEFVRPDLTGPLFLTHHPVDLKPLAKIDPDNPALTESFQLLVAGFEISNNYSELNDPLIQARNFAEQKKMKDAGDEEAMAEDHEFVKALEYGMPPTSGTGIGIDRLVALITDSHSLREVMAFPLMKPKEEE
jgi:lysyl-tRNA synthetase class 2